MRLGLIVGVDRHNAIGYRGELLFRLPEDMKFFRQTTLGTTIIMGRKTLAGFPGGNPLQGRENWVLSRRVHSDLKLPNCRFFADIEQVLAALRELPSEASAWVVGGSEIYRLFLPYCQIAYVSEFDCTAPLADVFFPDLAHDPAWQVVAKQPTIHSRSGVDFQIVTYKNLSPRPLFS